eukprot:430293-Hanusia_phi.AAC.1
MGGAAVEASRRRSGSGSSIEGLFVVETTAELIDAERLHQLRDVPLPVARATVADHTGDVAAPMEGPVEERAARDSSLHHIVDCPAALKRLDVSLKRVRHPHVVVLHVARNSTLVVVGFCQHHNLQALPPLRLLDALDLVPEPWLSVRVPGNKD